MSALAWCARVATAHAAPLAEEPIRVEDRSDASCTDAARFYARVAARTPRTRQARADEVTRVFIIQIARRGEGVSGRLIIRDQDGSETHRDIRGRDCGEVVNGLALIAALALDPAARPEPASTLHTAAPPSATAAPSATGAPSATAATSATAPPSATATSTTTAASPAPGPASPRSSTATARAVPSRARPAPESGNTTAATVGLPGGPDERADGGAGSTETPRWSGGIAARAAGFSGLAPQPLLGGALSVDLQRDSAESVGSPRLALSFEHGQHATFAVGSAGARFAYRAAALDLCPLRVEPFGRVAIHACARAALGLLTATGSQPESPERTVRRLWADVGLGARVAWPLSSRWAIDLQGGCTFPLRRDTYGFGPDSFHEVPWIAGVAALGIHLRLL